ncbi:hypothetical protein [Psychromonas aquatilis]|uniref:Small secreted protein n=1 Tax=Psychromonas aquatilis TaxID=2005072 RepID=A0ABU9GLQ4_9GAMM
MKNLTSYKCFAAIGAVLLLLSACSEGPAEETGEQLDETATDIGNSIEDTCEDVKDTLDAADKDC